MCKATLNKAVTSVEFCNRRLKWFVLLLYHTCEVNARKILQRSDLMKKIEKWMLDCFTKMKQYGIKQTELAEHMGLSRETINKALNGDNSMTDAEQRIASALDEIIKERH